MSIWKGEQTVQLIGLVENNPILYDQDHEFYENRELKEEIWENIAKNFSNFEGNKKLRIFSTCANLR